MFLLKKNHQLFKSAKNKTQFLLFIICFIFSACQTEEKLPAQSTLQLPERPNILWLVTEDMGPYIPSFGDSTIQTPNLSRLAAEGIRYTNVYSPSGVCAPSRAAIATGMYPSGIGANHMRTGSNTESTGLPAYEAVPQPEVQMISERLRAKGYYCTNNSKQDYQFKAPCTAWDENGRLAHWRKRSDDQPFFAVFNFNNTHESGLFEPYGFIKNENRHYQSGDTSFVFMPGRMREEETPVHVSKDVDFPIPPYLQNTEISRRDLWKMYNNIAEMDKQVGAILKQLEEDGLLENTIIFFYADHGGPLPRQKRLIYDSGLNVPMIIRFPNEQQAGTIDHQLISFIDFAPTLLSLSGLRPPDYLHGQAFLGKYQKSEKRKHIHAAADRFDEVTDVIRAVRDKQFKYIRNYRPEQGYYIPVAYRERIPTMKELLQLRDEEKLDSLQSLWFRASKVEEELYDCKNDPHELVNLCDHPEYSKKLKALRVEMDRWILSIGDQPNLPERELISQLWGGDEEQPRTAGPVIEASEKKVKISCATKGARIGYKILDILGNDSGAAWSIYSEPVTVPKWKLLKVQTHRIGYKPSAVVIYKPETHELSYPVIISR